MATQQTGRSNRPRLAAIIMIAAAVVGFVVNSEIKRLYRIANERVGHSTTAPIVVPLSPLSEHSIEFWAVDEEHGYGWADVDARFVVRDGNGTRLVEKAITASSSEENGGIKRASNGDTIQVPAGPTELRIDIVLNAGDYVDVEVYRDLPTWTALAPGVYALLGFVGVVLYLKARAREAA